MTTHLTCAPLAFVRSRHAAPIMSDWGEDEDFMALFEDFGEDDGDVADNLSANLRQIVAAGTVAPPVHQGDVDEGQLTWEAPSFAGLANSNVVGAGQLGYKTDRQAAVEDDLWGELGPEDGPGGEAPHDSVGNAASNPIIPPLPPRATAAPALTLAHFLLESRCRTSLRTSTPR